MLRSFRYTYSRTRAAGLFTHPSGAAALTTGPDGGHVYTVGQLLEARAAAMPDMQPVSTRLVPKVMPLLDAVSVMMAPNSVGAVIVVDQAAGNSAPASGKVQGIVAEKDYLLNLTHGAYPPSDVIVSQVAHSHLEVAQPSTPIYRVLESMLRNGRRHSLIVSPTAASAVAADIKAGLPASSLQAVLSMRDIVRFLTEKLTEKAAASAAAEVTVEDGHATSDGGSPTPAAHAAATPAAPPAKGTDGAPAASVSKSASSHAAEGAAAAKEQSDSVTWQSTVEQLLEQMQHQSAGKKILLNTRLDDNISVADAANVMAERGMSCVAVVDDDLHLVGLFTVRDFLTRVVLQNQNATTVRVRDIMTREPYATLTDRTVLKCAKTMLKLGFRHMPVTDEHEVVQGIVSMADVAQALLPACTPAGVKHNFKPADTPAEGTTVVQLL